MITTGPELDKFVVEPWMEIEPFDSKLIKEIFLNHPYKILLYHLNKHPPNYSRWKNEDINDFYFKMLDDYNRYGISFERNLNLFPGNILYVIKNEDKNFTKFEYDLLFKKVKHDLLSNNHYDKKTLLFNKVKKIDLNEYDRGEKPLSEEEKEKRDFIKEQKNKYLQVAMMDPDVYNNDKLFEDLMMESDDYYSFLDYKFHLIYIDGYLNDEYFKKEFKKQLNMIRKLLYRMNEGNDDFVNSKN